MEAQSTYTKTTKSPDNLFKQLLMVQIELEKFRNSHFLHFEQAGNALQSIDDLFESMMSNQDGWELSS